MEFSQIALLLVAAAISASFAKLLKQPLLIGYLFAGFVLALLGVVGNIEVFSGLGQVGVALLLFLVCIEMNLSELPSIGKVAALAGFGQILFTAVLGYILSIVLGYPPLVSLYFAAALSFSSTIIIV